jgi:hypothetical protein
MIATRATAIPDKMTQEGVSFVANCHQRGGGGHGSQAGCHCLEDFERKRTLPLRSVSRHGDETCLVANRRHR